MRLPRRTDPAPDPDPKEMDDVHRLVWIAFGIVPIISLVQLSSRGPAG